MESIIPSRYPILRLRKCVLALTVGLAAILLPATVAFAQLENQDQINRAVKAYEASTKQAVENIPDSEVMKRREDDLDRLSRAKTDADAAQKAAEATADAGKIDKAKKAATKAKELEEAARTLADHARTFETSEADKERAQEYREALEKRRAARLAMKELEAELKPKVDDRRALSADKELENEITRLRARIGRAEQPITSTSVAALTPFLPMTANVSTDSQKHCTFGKASPMSVAFEPSDVDGNALSKLDDDLERAIELALAGPAAPINISNPDPDAPKQNKPGKGGADAEAPGAKSPTKAEATSAAPKGAAASGPSADPLAGSILDQMDESKPASPPGGATASGTPTQPAPSTGPKRPVDTGLSLLGKNLQNGEAPEDAIDRFTKLANEALARGDRDSFEFYRRGVQAVATWVSNRMYDRSPIARTDEDGNTAFTVAQQIQLSAMLDARLTWINYLEEIGKWKFEPRSESAAAAAGTGEGKPTGTPSPTVESKPAAAPAQSAAPGEKSAPTPEKSKSSEKTGPGDKRASEIQKSNQSSQPAEKSTEKAEPGDKTPSSGAAAYPEKAAGNSVHITIHFKVTETALQGGTPSDEIKEQQLTKLTALEPALPKTGQTKTAKAKLDQGHDRSPVTCTTGTGGRCKAQVPADERESYGLPSSPAGAGLQDKPAAVADGDPLQALGAIPEGQNYSVALAVPKISGVVIQKGPAKLTSAQLAALTDAPPGLQVEKTDIKIGNKTFTRVGFAGPEAAIAALAKKFGDLFGKDVQIDFCIEKAPGPPLGMTPVSFSALNNELPLTTLDLRRRIQAGGTSK